MSAVVTELTYVTTKVPRPGFYNYHKKDDDPDLSPETMRYEVVIEDGVNGYLASDCDEWISKLTNLIEDPELRFTMGSRGRNTVEDRYSTEVCYKILRDKVLSPTMSPKTAY